MSRLRERLGKLPRRYRWVAHNLIGHPLMGVLQVIGAWEIAEAIHYHTMPAGEDDDDE